MTDQTYGVRLREAAKRRHRGLGRDCLTDKWLFEHNPGAFDSAQPVDPHTRRVLATVTPRTRSRRSGRCSRRAP